MDGEPHPTALTVLVAAFLAATSVVGAHLGADARWLAVVGGWVVDAGALPHQIMYAAAPSFGWHDAPVLGQLVFHAFESLFGDRGLVLLQFAAVATALWALVLDMRRVDARDSAAAAVLVALVAAAPAVFLVVRAELFSLALFPVLLMLLRREAVFRSGRIWLAPALVALWANLHGGALLGFGTLAAYLVLHRARRAPLESVGVLLAGAAALLATPAGLASVHYYAGVLRGEAAAEHVGMWAQLSTDAPLDVIFVVVGLPLVVAAVLRRPQLWELALIGAFAFMTVEARRNAVWLLLTAATPAARAFGVSRVPLVPRRLALLACTVPAVLVVAGFARPVQRDGASLALLTRAAALAQGSPILADPLDGEHLALRGSRIWIGNPLDAFERDQQRLYIAWLRGRPAGDAILRWPIRTVLVARGSEPQRRLAHSRSFREIGRDERAVLYAART